MSKVDIEKLEQEAIAEFNEERGKEIKKLLKKKLSERQKAKKVLANIDREIEDLKDEIAQED